MFLICFNRRFIVFCRGLFALYFGACFSCFSFCGSYAMSLFFVRVEVFVFVFLLVDVLYLFFALMEVSLLFFSIFCNVAWFLVCWAFWLIPCLFFLFCFGGICFVYVVFSLWSWLF